MSIPRQTAVRAAGGGGSAEFLRADMGDAAEVRALADAGLARNGSIDVLIHSAAGMPPPGARTREGVDRGFAQNFLGAFLLTRLLEERLLASAPARVIAVGSAAHRLVKRVDVDAFMPPSKDLSQMSSYQMLGRQLHGEQLPMRAAQLAGVLDLAGDEDTRALLSVVLADVDSTADVRLTSETEKAYGAFVDRFNRMWTLSDPPHRRQY